MVVSLVQAFMLGVQTWETRRFVRQRKARPPGGGESKRVALFAPCKGQDVGLLENLRPLLRQDHPNYEVVFVVESEDDPAVPTIRALLDAPRDVPARLAVAGRATGCGQKVHNLRYATGDLPPDIEILAFVDSDARPREDWLRYLVQRLDRPGAGAATGYRWFVPARPTVANWVLYSVNSTAAGLLGPGVGRLVWGGSWAVRREVFDLARIRDAWNGTLSDDLVATRALRHASLRVEFEPACVTASPLDGDWRQTLSFLRRQYLIGRFYIHRWWAITLVWTTVSQVGFWGGLAAATIGMARGESGWPWPAAIALAWYATFVIRGMYRRDMARLYVGDVGPSLAAAIWFDMLAGPLAAAINWALLFCSMWGRHIHWRGISYRLDAGGGTRPLVNAATPRTRPVGVVR